MNNPKKRILIIEDDRHIAEGIQLNLTLQGYEVVIAPDGVAGLNKWKEIGPDLVVLDVLMPKQSGIRLYRILKTEKALQGIPVIILSGVAKRTFLRSQKALTEFGDQPVPEPESYLEKPVEPEDIPDTYHDFLVSQEADADLPAEQIHVYADVDGNIGAWGLARGGMGAISRALAGALAEHGGEIRTSSGVKQVLVEQALVQCERQR